jgi:chromosome segregation ATPase
MANQQTDTKVAADKTPALANDTPEKTYTQAEYDRVDKNRREVQKKLDALMKQHAELQDSYDTTLADNKALGVTLEEASDDEKLKAAIKDHTQAVAKYNKERLILKKERDEFDGIVSETANEKLNGMRQSLNLPKVEMVNQVTNSLKFKKRSLTYCSFWSLNFSTVHLRMWYCR